MVKAKENKKVVGSYKTVKEAAQAMVDQKKAVNVKAAAWNIYAALAGGVNRNGVSQTVSTAYGYSWSQTVSKTSKATVTGSANASKPSTKKATKSTAKKSAAKSTKKTSKKSSKTNA